MVSPAYCVRTVEEEYVVSSGGESCVHEKAAECKGYTTGKLREGKYCIRFSFVKFNFMYVWVWVA